MDFNVRKKKAGKLNRVFLSNFEIDHKISPCFMIMIIFLNFFYLICFFNKFIINLRMLKEYN